MNKNYNSEAFYTSSTAAEKIKIGDYIIINPFDPTNSLTYIVKEMRKGRAYLIRLDQQNNLFQYIKSAKLKTLTKITPKECPELFI